MASYLMAQSIRLSLNFMALFDYYGNYGSVWLELAGYVWLTWLKMVMFGSYGYIELYLVITGLYGSI